VSSQICQKGSSILRAYKEKGETTRNTDLQTTVNSWLSGIQASKILIQPIQISKEFSHVYNPRFRDLSNQYVTRNNRLMLSGETVDIYCDHMKHIIMRSFFFNFKVGSALKGYNLHDSNFVSIARRTVSSSIVRRCKCLRTLYAIVLLGGQHLRGLWQYVRATAAQVHHMTCKKQYIEDRQEKQMFRLIN
jgi:hypothetical protein